MDEKKARGKLEEYEKICEDARDIASDSDLDLTDTVAKIDEDLASAREKTQVTIATAKYEEALAAEATDKAKAVKLAREAKELMEEPPEGIDEKTELANKIDAFIKGNISELEKTGMSQEISKKISRAKEQLAKGRKEKAISTAEEARALLHGIVDEAERERFEDEIDDFIDRIKKAEEDAAVNEMNINSYIERARSLHDDPEKAIAIANDAKKLIDSISDKPRRFEVLQNLNSIIDDSVESIIGEKLQDVETEETSFDTARNIIAECRNDVAKMFDVDRKRRANENIESIGRARAEKEIGSLSGSADELLEKEEKEPEDLEKAAKILAKAIRIAAEFHIDDTAIREKADDVKMKRDAMSATDDIEEWAESEENVLLSSAVKEPWSIVPLPGEDKDVFRGAVKNVSREVLDFLKKVKGDEDKETETKKRITTKIKDAILRLREEREKIPSANDIYNNYIKKKWVPSSDDEKQFYQIYTLEKELYNIVKKTMPDRIEDYKII